MTEQQMDDLQGAWFLMRDVNEELNRADLAGIMDALHRLIDDELEKGVAA